MEERDTPELPDGAESGSFSCRSVTPATILVYLHISRPEISMYVGLEKEELW